MILGHFGHFGHFGSFWSTLGHFGHFWSFSVILGHFGRFWVILVIFDLNWAKTRIWPYFLPTGPDFQNSSTSRCGIPMCIFASLCKNCERNFFRVENSFFYFSAPRKGIFSVGFFIFVVRRYFSKGARNFFSPKKIFFYSRKITIPYGPIKKTVSYNFFPDNMPKIQKNRESWR